MLVRHITLSLDVFKGYRIPDFGDVLNLEGVRYRVGVVDMERWCLYAEETRKSSAAHMAEIAAEELYDSGGDRG